MPILHVEGYGNVELPEGMSTEEMHAAVYDGISTGQIKPIASAHNVEMDESFFDGFKSRTPEEEKASVNEKVQNIFSIAPALAEGLKRGGAGILQGLNSVLAPGVLAQATERPMGALKDYMQKSGEEFSQQYPGEFPQGVASLSELASQLIPLSKAGTAVNLMEGIPAIANTLKNAPSAIQNLGSAAGIFGKNAAFSGTAAPFVYDKTFEKQTGENIVDEALIGGLFGTGLAGALRSPQLGGKILSMFGDKEAAQKTIPQLKGLNTFLGEAISSPTLKNLEEVVLSKVPLSGVKSSQYKTGKKLEGEGEGLLRDLASDSSYHESAVGEKIKNNISDYSTKIDSESTALYNKASDRAEKSGTYVNTEDLYKTVDLIFKQIEEGNALGRIGSTVPEKLEKEVGKISGEYRKAIDLPEEIIIGGKTFKYDEVPSALKNHFKELFPAGEPFRKMTITGAQTRESELYDLASEAQAYGNNFLASIYRRMGASLNSDTKRAIKNSNDPTLKKLYKSANKFYKDFKVPLQSPEILKFIAGKGDPDTLTNFFVRVGKDDRSNLLGKLTDNISKKDKKLLGRDFLEQSRKDFEGSKLVDPKKMVSMFNNLGERSREKLFGKDFIDKMKEFSTRVHRNPSAAEAMFNPKTGMQATEAAGLATLGTLLGSGNIPAFAGTSAAFGAGSALSRFLRSEKARDMYLKGLLPMHAPSEGISKIGSAISGSRPSFSVIGLGPYED